MGKNVELRFGLAALVVAILATVPATAHAGLIVDGGFENPPAPNAYFTQYTGGQTFGGAWTVTGNDVLVINSNYVEGTSGTIHFNAVEGQQSVDLTGAGNTGLADGVQQQVSTTAGRTYFVSFLVGRTSGDSRYNTASTANLTVTGGNGVGIGPNANPILFAGSFTTRNTPTGGAVDWERFTASFLATGSSALIAFTNGTQTVANGGNNFVGLDDVSVYSTPEPATLVTLASGSLCLLGYRRIRRRHSA